MTVDAYKDAPKKVNFPNYELFNDVMRTAIDNIAPCKIKKIKANTQKLFDGEVSENINTRAKRFENSGFYIDKELYKKAKYNTLKLITAKKRALLTMNSQNILENQKNYAKP